MATVKPTAPAPHAWAAAFTQILPPRPPRRRRAGAVRASPPSTACSGDAGELLPARLQPNARRPLWHGGGFSLGVDLGDVRTGLAVGRGITQPRPLMVLKLRGQKLELVLLDVAQEGYYQRLGNFGIYYQIPRHFKCVNLLFLLRFAGGGRADRRASGVGRREGDAAVQQGPERRREARHPSGRQDEHGTSMDALNYMISRGVKRTGRDVKSDAYAAVMILERYFSSSGQETKIVLPKQQKLQDKLMAQSRQYDDIY